MRYDDWDILLFPRDCKVPVKEFKVACHVVHDSESPQLGGTFGIPTVCCFVPSLAAGTPFQVSIHSWNAPAVSQFTQSYSNFLENVRYEARLFIDGRLVASSTLERKSTWPHIIAHSFDFSKTGDLEALSFPNFRQELLQQNYWSPADELGRIKLVLSEGFPRDSITTPFERVKNIVAFSFQHAPLEILETSSIAWPNPSMWRRAPFAASMQVPTIQTDDSELHAHSPRRRGSNSAISRHTRNSLPNAVANSALVAGGRRVTHPVCGPLLYPAHNGLDPLGDAGTYFEWLNGMGMGMGVGLGDFHANNMTRSAAVPKSTRRSSTDISMPDYHSMRSASHGAEARNVPTALPEDEEGHHVQLKVPTNTPTTGIGYSREDIPYPIITQNASFPPELAESLTNSLLNQPLPVNLQQTVFQTPAMGVKSRKENREDREQQHISLSSTAVAGTSTMSSEHQESRGVSQQLYMLSACGGTTGKADLKEKSPNHYDFCLPTRTHVNVLQAACPARKPSTEKHKCEVRQTGEKGTKRSRNFTPASSRAIDEEDEPRRPSPRVRLSSLLDGQASPDATA